jgi:hypothetical protein
VPPDALVRPGTRVVAHAWADSSSATGRVFLVVEWRNAKDRLLYRDASPKLLVPAAAWHPLVVASRAPRRAAYARIELIVRGTTDPVWFDDVSFRQ